MIGTSMQWRRIRAARRLALLTTAIAGIGGTALVLAPNVPAYIGSALAQNLTEKVQQLPQRPVGFADIVEKVKPAVISVRVKIDRPADQGLNTDDGDLPFPPGSPFERFFKRFGAPNGVPPGGRQIITGQGSGFFITADGYAVTNNHVVENAATPRGGNAKAPQCAQVPAVTVRPLPAKKQRSHGSPASATRRWNTRQQRQIS